MKPFRVHTLAEKSTENTCSLQTASTYYLDMICSHAKPQRLQEPGGEIVGTVGGGFLFSFTNIDPRRETPEYHAFWPERGWGGGENHGKGGGQRVYGIRAIICLERVAYIYSPFTCFRTKWSF